MLMKIELHVHTRHSKDSLLGRHFLLLFCMTKGIGCLAITDHDNIDAAEIKPYLEARGIQVIIGEEVMTQEGEIIGLFLRKKVMPMMTAELTIREIKRQGGLVYVPHPADAKRQKTVLSREAIFRNASDIDFIEICNGRNSSDNDMERAAAICGKLRQMNPEAVTVVGGDAHVCWELGRNVGIVPETKLSTANLKAVLSAAEFTAGKPLPLAHKWTKAVKLLRLPMTLETMKYDVAPWRKSRNGAVRSRRTSGRRFCRR